MLFVSMPVFSIYRPVIYWVVLETHLVSACLCFPISVPLIVCDAAVDVDAGVASQEYYIRPRYGDSEWKPHQGAKLKCMLEAAIQRRSFRGTKACILVGTESLHTVCFIDGGKHDGTGDIAFRTPAAVAASLLIHWLSRKTLYILYAIAVFHLHNTAQVKVCKKHICLLQVAHTINMHELHCLQSWQQCDLAAQMAAWRDAGFNIIHAKVQPCLEGPAGSFSNTFYIVDARTGAAPDPIAVQRACETQAGISLTLPGLSQLVGRTGSLGRLATIDSRGLTGAEALTAPTPTHEGVPCERGLPDVKQAEAASATTDASVAAADFRLLYKGVTSGYLRPHRSSTGLSSFASS